MGLLTTLNCFKLRTLYIAIKLGGCFTKQAVYFNSFFGARLVDLDPFWFLFLISKAGVPLLLLYMKTNC